MRIKVFGVSGKWVVLFFAFSATVINYLDRQTLSVLAPVLLQRYDISAEAYSHIIFAFMLAYTLSNGVAGRFLDAVGTRVGYGVCIALWSGAEMLHGLATGALSFGVCRFLLGIGEAGNYPAGVKLISEWFPAEERSLASGIFNGGASIGAILAPPLLAWFALRSGTRAAFVLVGALGFLWLVAWWIMFPSGHRQRSIAHKRQPLGELLRSRFLWQFTVSKVFSDPVWYFYTFWFPQYLHVTFNFSLARIGATAWIPFFTAAIGNIAGGLCCSLLRRFNLPIERARRICVLIFSACMMFALLIPGQHHPAICIALISVATFGYSGALANLLALPGDVYGSSTVASVWGFASTGSGLGGMLFSLLTGWLVQRYSFAPAFFVFGTLPAIAAILVWTLPTRQDGGVPALTEG